MHQYLTLALEALLQVFFNRISYP